MASNTHVRGEGELLVERKPAGRVRVPELGIDVASGTVVRIPVEPWTADEPRLYEGELDTSSADMPGGKIALKIGFRTVKVSGEGVIQANGRHIIFRGVNRTFTRRSGGRSTTLRCSKKSFS